MAKITGRKPTLKHSQHKRFVRRNKTLCIKKKGVT